MGNYVIIGGGAAGISAAKAIRARDGSSPIFVYTKEPHLPYIRPALTQVLAGKIELTGMLMNPAAFYEQNRIEIIHEPIAAIDPLAHLVKAGNSSVQYDKLLIATGASPFNPVVRQHGSMQLFTLRSYDDALALIAACKDKRMLLIGGGILGLEAALALLPLCRHITILERGDRLLPQTDELTSRRIHEGLTAKGIDVLLSNTAAELTPKGALLSGGGLCQADLTLVSIGVRSNLDLAKTAGLAINKAILVDNHMKTSAPDIFAAGDCAEFDGAIPGLWMPSSKMGAAAGAAMTGDQTTPYTPDPPKLDLSKVLSKL